MKPNLGKFQNPETDRLAIKLTEILTHVNLDNVTYRFISGKTDTAPDTEAMFAHGMNPRPWIVIPVNQDGGVYIKTIGYDFVDIRSTISSSNFVVIALG